MSAQGLTHHELLIAFSALHPSAVVSIHYPSNDHQGKMRDACAHALREEGHAAAAEAVLKDAPFLAIESAREAVQVARCVLAHSHAMSVNVYWAGKQNEEVVEALRLEKAESDRREHLRQSHHDVGSFSQSHSHGLGMGHRA